MCGEFGEVTVIIGLVIIFLAFVPPFVSFRDTLSYISGHPKIILNTKTVSSVCRERERGNEFKS